MFKYLNFVFLFFVNSVLFAQELTVTQKIPDNVVSGTDYITEITINKSSITGFMKFFQEIPTGWTVVGMESKGGNFSFADGGVKIIWISVPAENPFTISYKVSVPKNISGTKTLTGKIAYLDKNERQTFELEPKIIKIEGGSVLSIPDVITTQPPVSIPAPVTENKKEEQVPVQEPIIIVKDTIAIAPDPVISVTENKAPITPQPVLTKKEEIKTPPTRLPMNDKVPVTAVPSSAGKTFRVQIGAFNSTPSIKGVPQPSKVVLDNGMTKYFSGNFKTYEEASNRKKELIEKGFQGAFIVSFENGKILK